MMLYKAILISLMLGAVFSGINECGLYSAPLPDSTAGMGNAEVTAFGESGGSAITALSVVGVIAAFIKVVVSACVSVVSFVPIFCAYGWPLSWAWMVAMIESPLYFIKLWGLYQLWTGHQTMGMD
ncbi:MAG: hypothetical protein WC683_11885 [bacterium]